MRNKDDIAYEFLDSLMAGTPDDFLNHLTNDVEIHICLGKQLYTDSYSGTFMGKNGARNLFKICGNFLEFISTTPSDFHYECEKMIVRGDTKCKLTTSQMFWTSSWMQIWTFSGDQVSKIQIFADYNVSPQAEMVSRKMNTGMSTPMPVPKKHSFFS
ncbi:MAG: hypothetical protein JKY04_07360 [Sneathiella sp.]|nr:hypothetical protein [Sneathiella sp.]